jgi:hypothetical protein
MFQIEAVLEGMNFQKYAIVADKLNARIVKP